MNYVGRSTAPEANYELRMLNDELCQTKYRA